MCNHAPIRSSLCTPSPCLGFSGGILVASSLASSSCPTGCSVPRSGAEPVLVWMVQDAGRASAAADQSRDAAGRRMQAANRTPEAAAHT